MSAVDGTLDLTPGTGVVLDGVEWLVERAEPQYGRAVLVTAAGDRMPVTFRFLVNHPGCHAFEQALADLADHLDLDSVGHLIDFGARRDVLAAWSIPDPDWGTLVDGLPTVCIIYNEQRRIAWDEPKRLLASVWVWCTVTHGAHIYAPSLRPDLQTLHRRTATDRLIQSRWPLITRSPRGIYHQLRQRLAPYADNLASRIDERTGTEPTR